MTQRRFERPGFLFPDGGGRPMLLTPVGAADKARIRVGVDCMSGYSRYLRFFTGTPTLTEDLLAYLTEIDQVDHVAWCALDPEVEGLPGIGLGRFVRLKDRPDVAEYAIAVVDAWQQRGVGTVLLGMLGLLAGGRGIRTLRGLVLPENEVMLDWLKGLGAQVQYNGELYVMDLTVEVDGLKLPDTPAGRRMTGVLLDLKGKWVEFSQGDRA